MGKKSGEQTTEIRLPPALAKAAEDNLAIANEVAAIGYTPYGGSTVAGFTPGQQAAFANTDAAAQAFNMPSVAPMGASGGVPSDPLTGIPLSSMDANGDYNPISIFRQALSAIPLRQRSMIESFVTSPQTGAWPANPAVPRPQYSPAQPTRTPVQRFPNAPASKQKLSPYEEWKQQQKQKQNYQPYRAGSEQ